MVAQTIILEDPAIRLFGKKIPLLPADGQEYSATHHQSEPDQDTLLQTHPSDYKGWSAANDTSKQEGYCCLVVDEEKVEQSLPDQKTTKYSEEKLEANSVQIIKKAEKILPCPRCKSMDTKFCYYNNYNMKQPRHFCRACQRYWTAGGTMRNVPVGAGRRKNNKNSSSTFSSHYITISSDALRIDPPAVPLLSFGSGAAVPNPSTLPANIFSCWQYPGGHVFYNPTGGFPLLQANYSIQKNYSSSSSSSSPKLGKHSREDHYSCLDTHKSPSQKNSSSTVLIPKTLRIDDPNDAAKSSIWETLGIKNESLIGGGAIFRGFKSKTTSTDHHGQKRSCVAETSPALLANPAAFSRSITFQETS